MPAKVIVPLFQWRDIPRDDREWLKNRTEALENYGYRIASDMIRIGQILIEVRLKLPRQFSSWLISETSFSRVTAYRYIAVATAFGPYLSLVDTIQTWALYLLAAESAPPEARYHAVQLARDGQVITRGTAIEIIAAYRVREPDKTERTRYEELKKRLDRKEQLRDRETDRAEWKDADHFERIGRVLSDLAGGSSMVSITRIDSANELGEVEEAVYKVAVQEAGLATRHASDRSLKAALETVAGQEPRKHCPGCCREGQGIPLSSFGKNEPAPDGLMLRCSRCEKSRKAAFREKARAGKVRKKRVRPPQVRRKKMKTADPASVVMETAVPKTL